MIRAADLVLTMTRAHRRTVLGLDPLALRRTFTLSEAAALARVSHVGDLTSGPTDGRASSLTARLDRARALRAGGATDDIPDPVAQPLPVHRQVAIRISAELDVMTNLMLSATMTA